MDVILLEKVQNVGNLGDKVSVKPGYGRNFLIPQGKAVAATAANLADFEARRAELEKAEADARATAAARAAKLEGLSLSIARQAGEEGKLFGSVGTSDIAEAVVAAGVEVEKKEVRLPEGTLRNTGEYDVDIQVHSDITVAIKLEIVPE